MPATEKKGPIPTYVVDPLMDFARNSKFLLNKCHKPDAKGTRCVDNLNLSTV